MARRENARTAPSTSSIQLPCDRISTSAPLFVVPTRVVPCRANARSASGTAGSRYRAGRWRATGSRTRRPARHDGTLSSASRPITVTITPPETAAQRGIAENSPQIAPTSTLNETLLSPGVESARSTPSTVANTSPSSGGLRPSAIACARALSARSSNATRSVGRQAARHASTERRAPPTKKHPATPATSGRSCPNAQAEIEAAAQMHRDRITTVRGRFGAARPAAAPAMRPIAGTAATARTRTRSAKSAAVLIHEVTKDYEETKSCI